MDWRSHMDSSVRTNPIACDRCLSNHRLRSEVPVATRSAGYVGLGQTMGLLDRFIAFTAI